MNVKAWLNRAKNIDREINHLVEERDKEYARLISITPSYTADTVQSSKDPHKFDRLAEYKEEIDRQIDNLLAVKTEIITGIAKLEDGRHREILMGRYIENLTFEEIAVRIHYSYKQTCRLHGRALLKMEVIINGT